MFIKKWKQVWCKPSRKLTNGSNGQQLTSIDLLIELHRRMVHRTSEFVLSRARRLANCSCHQQFVLDWLNNICIKYKNCVTKEGHKSTWLKRWIVEIRPWTSIRIRLWMLNGFTNGVINSNRFWISFQRGFLQTGGFSSTIGLGTCHQNQFGGRALIYQLKWLSFNSSHSSEFAFVCSRIQFRITDMNIPVLQ